MPWIQVLGFLFFWYSLGDYSSFFLRLIRKNNEFMLIKLWSLNLTWFFSSYKSVWSQFPEGLIISPWSPLLMRILRWKILHHKNLAIKLLKNSSKLSAESAVQMQFSYLHLWVHSIWKTIIYNIQRRNCKCTSNSMKNNTFWYIC